jgi:xylulokinase
MSEYVIAYDLGTSSTKASLYNQQGLCITSAISDYPTYYSEGGHHEQKPADWWNAVRTSTKELLEKSDLEPTAIRAASLSGQSLAVVPIDARGNLLTERVPIWSDSSAKKQADDFFSRIDEDAWYMITGNGFSRACYSLFKIMQLRDNKPELYKKIDTILGSKDYINYLLTGRTATDYSYASGLGAYNLAANRYHDEFLAAAGIDKKLFPEPMPSVEPVGKLSRQAAAELGLHQDIEVFCGGVDNSCMALGAGVYSSGSQYLSLGSSAWIAVSTEKPLVDKTIRPFIFSHVVPDAYTSATAIFSAGSTLRWLRDTTCADLVKRGAAENISEYTLMMEAAEKSPPGARGLLCNPSLGGIPASYHSPDIKGGLYGLSLEHTREDLTRAVLEGICMDLAFVHERLAKIASLSEEMIIVGGGSRSPFWRQMFADIFNMKFVKISTGQDAASLGAAAIASVGKGWWENFDYIHTILKTEATNCPDPEHAAGYRRLRMVNAGTWSAQSELGGVLNDYH